MHALLGDSGGGGARLSALLLAAAPRGGDTPVVAAFDARADDARRVLAPAAELLGDSSTILVSHDARGAIGALADLGVAVRAQLFDTQAVSATLSRHVAGGRAPRSSTGDCAPLSALVARFLGGAVRPATAESAEGAHARPVAREVLEGAAADTAVLLPLRRRLLLEIDLIGAIAERRASGRQAPIGGVAREILAAAAAACDLRLSDAAARAAIDADAAGTTWSTHASVRGVVSNVTKHGVFVYLGRSAPAATPAAEPVHGLVSHAEWRGPPSAAAAAAAESPPLPRVGERLALRVLSCNVSADGRHRVALTRHAERLNPTLAAARDLAPGDELNGRVVHVDASRALVSLELPRAAILRARDVHEAEGCGDPRPLRVALNSRLAPGDILRVRVGRLARPEAAETADAVHVHLSATLPPPTDRAPRACTSSGDFCASGTPAPRSGLPPEDVTRSDDGGPSGAAPSGPMKRSWESDSDESDDEGADDAGAKRRRCTASYD